MIISPPKISQETIVSEWELMGKPDCPDGHKDVYVLKVFGKHSLVFKTKHESPDYLKSVGQELIETEESHFTHFEIVFTCEANEELTHPEFLVHPVRD